MQWEPEPLVARGRALDQKPVRQAIRGGGGKVQRAGFFSPALVVMPDQMIDDGTSSTSRA